jgi:hypothetical protein
LQDQEKNSILPILQAKGEVKLGANNDEEMENEDMLELDEI